jgi:hypothetical protein
MDQPLSGPIVHRPKSKPGKVKVRESLRSLASETRSRIRDQGLEVKTSETLESEASETHMSEASETVESKTSESEALASKTLEFRDREVEFI